jgi:hypothetical protein
MLDNIRITAGFTMKVLSSLNGNTFTVSDPVLLEAAGTYRKYGCRKTGLNHSLVFAGAFHATSLELAFTDAGDIRP